MLRCGEVWIFCVHGTRFTLRQLHEARIDRFCQPELRPATLSQAEDIARTAQLPVDLGELEAVSGVFQRLQALLRVRRWRGRDENAEGFVRAAPHATPELVKLRQPKPLGVLYKDYTSVRDVDPDLDYGCRDEDI